MTLIIYKGLARPCIEDLSHVCGRFTHTVLSNKIKSKAFGLTSSTLLMIVSSRSVVYFSVSCHYFHAYCFALLNLLRICLHPSSGLVAQDLQPNITPMLPKVLMSQPGSCLLCSSLVNFGTVFLCLNFTFPTTEHRRK